MDQNKTWLAGHQPVLDFHTGLVAKAYETQRRGGTFLFHDLDTMEEDGAFRVGIPNPAGGINRVPLLNITNGSRKQIFSFGAAPVMPNVGELLRQAVKTWANGRLPKPLLDEVSQRIKSFAEALEGMERRGAALPTVVTRFVLWHVIPRLGFCAPRILFFSDLLREEGEWKRKVESAWDRFGRDEFWALNGGTRHPVEVGVDVTHLIADGKLIPKAVALAYMLRGGDYAIIRGTGQARYEGERSEVLPEAECITVTSHQGVPPAWRALAPEGFRPSALLLWLLGGQFDPELVEIS